MMRFGLPVLALISTVGLLAACQPVVNTPAPGASKGSPQAVALTTTPAATKAASPSPTLSPSATATSTSGPGRAASPTPTPKPPAAPNIEVLAKGLQTPWAIGFAPDGRIFLTERPGRIRVIRDGQLQADPWMVIGVVEAGETGLLGLALDPQFAQRPFIYVAYTYRGQGGSLQNRLVRLREDPASGKGVLDKVLVDGVGAANNHDGGRVKFGPDGRLYWTMGENFNRPPAQDLSSLNGKILRLNSDGTIPGDNPLPNSYVYSYGHRNPQGLAWQPGTGRLYETEHGPSGEKGCCQDEVNLIEPGKNYGWPIISGDESREGLVSPILQSGNAVTWAPAGATFVTGGPWTGSLLFAGLRGQALYRLTLDPNDPRKVQSLEELFKGQFGRLREVVEGPDGAVYISTSNRDGRGSPGLEDDRVLRVTFK